MAETAATSMNGGSGSAETTLTRWKAKGDDFLATKLGVKSRNRKIMYHYMGMLWEQLRAMLPITLLQVLVLAIFFQKTTPTPGLEAAGLISAVIGLVLFLEGLRVAVMPMAMLVGEQLPKRLKLPLVLLVAFALGVLVTYAEPAIAAIRPLALLVDPNSAPYLYYLMNQQQEIMVLAIGIGVGVAAVLGTLKFLYNWSLKPMIAVTLLPTIGLACYMQWGNNHLQPLLGVAWDCGAVTTGPVTVPVLLSLGVGVMDAQRQKRAAQAVLEDAALKKSEGNTLEGFGIVTLASLLPVLAVELMAVIIGARYPYDYVLAQAKLAAEHAATAQYGPAELSPVKEIVYAVRAISPLLVALVLLVVVVLHQPLPSKGFSDFDDEAENSSSTEAETDLPAAAKDVHDISADRAAAAAAAAAKSGQIAAGGKMSSKDCALTDFAASDKGDVEQGLDQASKYPDMPAPHSQSTPPHLEQSIPAQRPKSLHHTSSMVGRHTSVAEAVILAADDKWAEDYYGLDRSSRTGSWSGASDWDSSQTSAASNRMTSCLAGLKKYTPLLIAMLMCQVGMILFNLGLTYGFAALGDMTGVTLPLAFLRLPEDPRSPYYSFAGGVTITMVTIFLLGILATKAEPALNVLGATVETLSGGKFTKKALIWAVCVGVAVGMCAGACKILFQLPLIWFILVKYAVAGGLTVIARESITAVAWDSAGVTTGPVTVPFVLSIGIGFSKAVGAPEGFGMLTVMSVAPIISVLLVSLLKQPVKQATQTLVRVSKIPLQRISRPLRSSGGGDSSGHGPPRSDTPGQMDAIAEVRDSIIAVNPPDLQTAPQHQLQQQA